ncbi:hypothetical protein [Nostoc sp. NMS9]|nr:hypothetical protein [Nostoc sp. NMS9]MBN3941691.1 hypothetical protein [Nostoc sp. NMS9]
MDPNRPHNSTQLLETLSRSSQNLITNYELRIILMGAPNLVLGASH